MHWAMEGSQAPSGSKILSWVPWQPEPRITVLARTISNLRHNNLLLQKSDISVVYCIKNYTRFTLHFASRLYISHSHQMLTILKRADIVSLTKIVVTLMFSEHSHTHTQSGELENTRCCIALRVRTSSGISHIAHNNFQQTVQCFISCAL
jgi:hypothetical protein